jgi:hypothetical protein
MKDWKSAERSAAKQFSLWVGFQIQRTPMSGAGTTFPGDLIPVRVEDYERWRLLVEVKTRKVIRIDGLLKGTQKWFSSWWEQTKREALEYNRSSGKFIVPILIFKANRQPWYIVFPYFTEACTILSRYLMLRERNDLLLVTPLKHFLNRISYEEFLEYVKWN